MTTEIKICMGSACFAKGNQENLEYIKEYIEENNLDSEITIVGALCENKCDIGPRIIINEKEYTNITKEKIKEILDSYKKIINLN
ncbi:(2Fe-2S) ferredoxin domain-containing protein [bacterium]|nr:(2Fe-2S) ferredoxin domain-containing protein [bacterium]